MDNIRIRLVTMPTTVKGVTIEDFEGNYTIFINDCYNEITRWKTLRHEVEHIRKHHFDNNAEYISTCEDAAKMTEDKIKRVPKLRQAGDY